MVRVAGDGGSRRAVPAGAAITDSASPTVALHSPSAQSLKCNGSSESCNGTPSLSLQFSPIKPTHLRHLATVPLIFTIDPSSIPQPSIQSCHSLIQPHRPICPCHYVPIRGKSSIQSEPRHANRSTLPSHPPIPSDPLMPANPPIPAKPPMTNDPPSNRSMHTDHTHPNHPNGF